MNKERQLRLEKILSLAFKVLFLLYSFGQTMTIFHRTMFVSVTLWSMILLGGIVCILRVFSIEKYLKTKGLIWLVFFLISYLVSIVCNKKYGIRADFANLIILAFMVGIVYATKNDYKKEYVRKEIQIISKMFIIIMDIAIIISILMLLKGYGNIVYYENYSLRIGIVENRLWGVFIDPNLAAVYSVVCIWLAWLFAGKSKYKIGYILTVVLDFLYLAFSDSRTGQVSLFISALFIIWMVIRGKFKNKNKFFRSFVQILITICLSAILLILPTLIQNSYNVFLKSSEIQNEEDTMLDEKVIQRDYDLSEDITNKRVDIWKSGLEIFMTKPVVGIGFHHLRDYVKQEVPETYLARDNVNFSHFHNEWLNILVSQGILGFALFLVFAITSIVVGLKRYFQSKNDEFFENTILIGCLLTICVGIMLNQGILYAYVPTGLLFWMYLSYICNNG